MAEKKKRLTIPLALDLPDPMEFLEEAETTIDNVEETLSAVDHKIREFDRASIKIDRKLTSKPLRKTVFATKTFLTKPKTPESGKTFEGQSDEAYCLECIEGHSMKASTEVGHAIDRFRSAGTMTEGVTKKVRAAIKALTGIDEDVTNTESASSEVKEGLDEILDEVRWIRKEYGISGGLTRGIGTMEDLEALRARISAINLQAYELVEKCPSCKLVSKDLRHRMEGGKQEHE